MKKILIALMLLIFVLSPMSFARSNWGIGLNNVVQSMFGLSGGYSQMPAGTLFFNFNDQHSIEGSIGVLRDAAEDGDTLDLTAIALKYLFNFYTSRNLNTHVGVIGIWGQSRYDDGDSYTYTDLVLVFGGETFLTDNLSLLIDLTAHSSASESEPTDSDDSNTTSINVFPTASFRLYL